MILQMVQRFPAYSLFYPVWHCSVSCGFLAKLFPETAALCTGKSLSDALDFASTKTHNMTTDCSLNYEFST